jgi:hypothetical protein
MITFTVIASEAKKSKPTPAVLIAAAPRLATTA